MNIDKSVASATFMWETQAVKCGNKQPLTLMNQWPFNHIRNKKTTRNQEILGANGNGQMQKNRITVDIPIGHSSA